MILKWNEVNLLLHILQSGIEKSRFIIHIHNYFETNFCLGIEYEFRKNDTYFGKILYSERFLNVYLGVMSK